MKRVIVPAVLTESVADLQTKIDLMAGVSERIGVDIIDGEFADNITVLPEDLQALQWHEMEREAQLMTVEPVDYLGLLHTAGFSRVYGHIERMGSVEEYLRICGELSLKAGLALDLYTPIEALEDAWLERVDGVLLMSVPAGFSGQEYRDVGGKIKELLARGFEGEIQIDGGMDEDTIPELLNSGATAFSVTSALWEAKDPREEYRKLTALLEV